MNLKERNQLEAFMEQTCRYTCWPTTWDTTDTRQFTQAVEWVAQFLEKFEEWKMGQPGYCFIHNTIEVESPNQEVYCICFECKHVYLTGHDLVRAYNQTAPDGTKLQQLAREISFCPYCLHDF